MQEQNSTAQNLNAQKSSSFIKVPTFVIAHSLKNNKCILPLYMYSAIHSNPNCGNIVDTNLCLISDTFYPSNPSMPGKFLEALAYLNSNIENSSGLPEFHSHINIIYPSTSSKISKTSRIMYSYFFDTYSSTKWVKVLYDEYFYILDTMLSANNNSGKIKYNIIELINFYMYLKQKIYFYSGLFPNNSMHESLTTISKNTGLSRNTLTKYTNQLIELKLIKTTKISTYEGNDSHMSNEYSLSDEWSSNTTFRNPS